MTQSTFQFLAETLTQRVANTAVESVLMVGLVWAVLHFVRATAKVRFAIWFSTLAAIVVLPILPGHVLIPGGDAAETASRTAVAVSGIWAVVFVFIWTLGTTVFLLRLALGFWRLRALLRKCRETQMADAPGEIVQHLREFALREAVAVCVSDGVVIPSAIGFLRPAIVLPPWMLPQTSIQELQAILLHELAHLRRRDHWTNLLLQLLKAFFFFHPAVWMVGTRLAAEREMACDEMALARDASPNVYASSLLSFAEKLQSHRAVGFVQALIGRVGELSLRIRRILEHRPSRQSRPWIPIAAFGVALFVVVLGVTPRLPEVVRFKQQAGVASRAALRPPIQELPTLVTLKPGAVRIQAAKHPIAHKVQMSRTAETGPATAMARSAAMPTLVSRSVDSGRSFGTTPVTVVLVQTTATSDFGSVTWTVWVWRVEGRTEQGVIREYMDPAMIVNLI